VTTLYQTDFSAAFSGSWGTDWTRLAGNAGLNVSGGQATSANGGTGNVMVAGSSSASFDITQTVTIGDSNNIIGPIGRLQDSNNFYYADLGAFANTLVFGKRISGTFNDLQLVSFTAAVGTAYKIRFTGNGTAFQVKAWAASGSEPGTWNITTTDSSISASGRVGIFAYTPVVTAASVDDFLATDGVTSTHATKVYTARFYQITGVQKPFASRFSQMAGASKSFASRLFQLTGVSKAFAARFSQLTRASKAYASRMFQSTVAQKVFNGRFYQYATASKLYTNRFIQSILSKQSFIARFSQYARTSQAFVSRFYQSSIVAQKISARFYQSALQAKSYVSRLFQSVLVPKIYPSRFFHVQAGSKSIDARFYQYSAGSKPFLARFGHIDTILAQAIYNARFQHCARSQQTYGCRFVHGVVATGPVAIGYGRGGMATGNGRSGIAVGYGHNGIEIGKGA
jgi:hypothetical protein